MTAGTEVPRVRLTYVLEAGKGVGWGHASRARALMEQADPESRLLVGRGFEDVRSWAREVGLRSEVMSWLRRDEPMGALPDDVGVMVVDGYEVPASWIEGLIGRCPVVVVDDWLRPAVRADVLVNPNIGASPADYPNAVVDQALCGSEFAFVRNEVRMMADRCRGREHTDPPRRLLVTLGGSDPTECTAQVAEIVRNTDWFRGGVGELEIVLGRSYTGPDPVVSWSDEERSLVKCTRSPQDFVERCARADLVVTGAGSTTYELAHLGTPFIPIVTAPNHERLAKGWAAAAGRPLIDSRSNGWQPMVQDRLIAALGSPAVRAEMEQACRPVLDGKGVNRVLERLAGLPRTSRKDRAGS